MVRAASVLVALAAAVAPVLAACKSNTGLLQMVTYVKRREDLTQQEFWDYWETQHAPKVAPLAAHFNISRYQQVGNPLLLGMLPITRPCTRASHPLADSSRWQDPSHRCLRCCTGVQRSRRL